MVYDLLRFGLVSGHRIGMSKTRPTLSLIGVERKPALKLGDGLGQFAFLLIRPAQKAIIQPAIRIQVDGAAELLNRFIPLAREYENGYQGEICVRPSWIELPLSLRYRNRLISILWGGWWDLNPRHPEPQSH
jgi:hypothetical protein